MQKRLYRSTSSRMLAGVCGGIAEYFNIDPTIVRILWVVVSLFGFAGIVAYLAGMFIIPEKPDSDIIDAE